MPWTQFSGKQDTIEVLSAAFDSYDVIRKSASFSSTGRIQLWQSFWIIWNVQKCDLIDHFISAIISHNGMSSRDVVIIYAKTQCAYTIEPKHVILNS